MCVCVCVRVQGVFDHRIKTWQKWQDSQLLLLKKRESEAKLQHINKPDKLQQARDEIKEVRPQGRDLARPPGRQPFGAFTFPAFEINTKKIYTHAHTHIHTYT